MSIVSFFKNTVENIIINNNDLITLFFTTENNRLFSHLQPLENYFCAKGRTHSCISASPYKRSPYRSMQEHLPGFRQNFSEGCDSAPLNWGLSLTRFMERTYVKTWMLSSLLHTQVMLPLASVNFYEKKYT